MCGILFFRILNAERKEEYVRVYRMIRNAIGSRGPESRNDLYFEKEGVYLTFHRLATYGELDSSNMMPIQRDGWILMCNGDIYNHRDLWQTLDNKTPNTKNDCEVLIPLIDSTSFTPDQIRGVFATVAWNPENKHLVVMRDAFGVRPLFSIRIQEEFEVYCSDLRIVSELNATLGESEQRLLEVEEIVPGTISHIYVCPYTPMRRYTYRRWYSFPNIDKALLQKVDLHNFTNSLFKQCGSMIHTALVDSIQARIRGATRPFGCLVSGGLDSSLVAGILRFLLPKEEPLYTYSIGMKGATDEVHARAVADHIDSLHTHFLVTKEEMLEAIPEVIRAIGSYDTTTVRASVGNYLVCKKIKERGECVYLFNGDGADELMGGYLYFHNAPDPITFDKECLRLLQNIHSFDVLRSDRSIAGNGFAPRTPYLDTQFVNTYLSIPIEIRVEAQQMCEKYLIRKGCEPYDYIPKSVLWRKKEAMSDGVSSEEDSWHVSLQKYAEAALPQKLHMYPESKREILPPQTKEQLLYRRIYEEIFGSNQCVVNLIPYYWMPQFVSGGAKDSSARSLAVYHEDDSKNGKQQQEASL